MGGGGEGTEIGVEMPDDGKLAETGVAKPDSSVMNRTRCRCNCRTTQCGGEKKRMRKTYLGKFWDEDEYEDGEIDGKEPWVIMCVMGGGQETRAE